MDPMEAREAVGSKNNLFNLRDREGELYIMATVSM